MVDVGLKQFKRKDDSDSDYGEYDEGQNIDSHLRLNSQAQPNSSQTEHTKQYSNTNTYHSQVMTSDSYKNQSPYVKKDQYRERPDTNNSNNYYQDNNQKQRNNDSRQSNDDKFGGFDIGGYKGKNNKKADLHYNGYNNSTKQNEQRQYEDPQYNEKNFESYSNKQVNGSNRTQETQISGRPQIKEFVYQPKSQVQTSNEQISDGINQQTSSLRFVEHHSSNKQKHLNAQSLPYIPQQSSDIPQKETYSFQQIMQMNQMMNPQFYQQMQQQSQQQQQQIQYDQDRVYYENQSNQNVQRPRKNLNVRAQEFNVKSSDT